MARRLLFQMLLTLTLCLLLAGAAAAETTRVKAVILGDMKPFSYIDLDTGVPAGFGVDVLNAVAARAGLQVDYRAVGSWKDVEDALLSGEADIAPGISVTDYRRSFIAFTDTFETFGITINIRADSSHIKGLSDLYGLKTGVIKASQASLLLKAHPKIDLVTYDSFHAGLFDLLAGRIDAFLIPGNIFNGLVREIGVEEKVRTLSPPIVEIKRAFGVRNDETWLLQLINSHLATLIDSPEYAQIYAKWFGKPKPFWTAQRVATAMGGFFLLVMIVMAFLRYRTVTRYNLSLKKNIEERKKTALALQEQEEQLRLLLTSTAEAIYGLDLEGRCTFANPSCLRMLGYETENDILGKNMHNLIHHTRPDGTPFMEADCQTICTVREEQCVHTDNELFWRADGSSFLVEYWSHPIIHDGKLTGAVVTFLDVTERKKLQASLARSENYLSSVFNQAGDAIYIVDIRSRIVDCNQRACESLGYSRYELLQLSLDDIDNQDAQENAAELFNRMAPRQVITIEKVHRRKNGTTYPVEIRIAILETDDQKMLMGFARDISERKLAEEAIRALNLSLEQRVAQRTTQLEKSNRELESFCYTVSHDLRAPLRHISSYATIMREDYFDRLDEDGQDLLQRIRSASNHMGELIDDILSLSRVSRADMTISEVNLSELAANAVAMFRESDPQRQVTVSIEDNLMAQGDATLLQLVMQNLIGNAWKYSSINPDAVIEMSRDTSEGKQAFCIRDNGIGFDMAYHDKMFKPFERLHGAEFEGTGIGLATVQRILERHGGEIWAKGEKGKGARFYFTLPGQEG
jgi:PAS domain S-box-containing protein